jgi:hypothetical protein
MRRHVDGRLLQGDRAHHDHAAHQQGVGIGAVFFGVVRQADGAALAALVFILDLIRRARAHQGRAQRAAGLVPTAAGIGRDHDAQLGRQFGRFTFGLGDRCGRFGRSAPTREWPPSVANPSPAIPPRAVRRLMVSMSSPLWLEPQLADFFAVQYLARRGSTSTATTITTSVIDMGRWKNTGAALAYRHGVAQLRLCQRAQDHADHHRRGREVKAPHQHAQQADGVQQEKSNALWRMP